MFSPPSMEPSLSFTNVNITTIPTTSFVNDFGSLKAIKTTNGIKAVTAVCVLFLINYDGLRTKVSFNLVTLTVLLNSGMLYSAAFCTNYDVTNGRFAATSAAGYVIFY